MISRFLRISLAFSFALLLTQTQSFADDVQVSASVDATDITINEQIQLVIELENADQFPSFNLNLDKFAIISGPAKSSNFQWINGKSFSSKKISYTIAPLETGDLKIGPFEMMIDGTRYTTNQITVHVAKGSRPPSASRSGGDVSPEGESQSSSDDVVFIKATADKSKAVPGEQVTVTYEIYTRVSIRNYSIENLPDAVGFWKEDIATPKNPKLTQEVVNGIRYSKATIKKIAYFPTQSGTLTITPMPVVVEIQSSRRRSLFDDFFNGDPFGRGATKRLVSNPIKIDVKPLPTDNQPNTFTGTVGQFTMASTLDTNIVKIDEAVGLDVTITGTGNIPTVTLANPEVPASLEMFDPEIEKSSRVDGGKVAGNVTYQYVFIPRKEGTVDLPTIRFAYYDPDARRYRTLSSGTKTIKVLPQEQRQQITGSGFSREEVKLLNMDIRYLKTNPGQLRQAGARYYAHWSFYAVLLLSLGIIGGCTGYRYWLEEWGQDAAYMRRREAMKRANQRIKSAEAHEDKPEYFSNLSRAILGFIGDKTNIAENALQRKDVTVLLRDHALPDETITEIERFLDRCDAGRFAPVGQDQLTEEELVPKAKSLIQTLNQYL